MRDRAGQGEMKPADWTQPQVVVDLIGNYSINKANTLYLKADNLLDSAFVASRRPFGIRPAQPLMVMLGYKHAFGAVEEPAAAKP
jgi:Fe(3+) dicitrate transport protein